MTEPRAVRWADSLLRSVVRPADFEPMAGDLLEEYREVRLPALGAVWAQGWYAYQVLSIFWRVVWPYAAALIAVKVVALALPTAWNPSLVPAPGVSLVDALAYVAIGFIATQRTRLMRTGILAAGTIGILAFKLTFAVIATQSPALLLAPFEKPFIFVIVLALAFIALGFAVVWGTVGAAVAAGFTSRRSATPRS